VKPWESDVALDPEAVARIVTELWKELAPAEVVPFNEGWDSRAFLVNQAWVFRFPKRAEVVPDLEKELRLLPALTGRLGVPIPAFQFDGRSDQYPFRFAGYRRIDGLVAPEVPASRLNVGRVTAQLASFIDALHGVSVDEARALGVPSDEESPESRAAGAGEVLAAIEGKVDGALVAKARAVIEAPPPAYGGPPRLIHDDLLGEHIIITFRGDRVAGIVDWGDAAIGDPAADFAGVHAWLGNDGLEAVLARITTDVDDGLRARASFGSALAGVDHVRYGLEANRAEYVKWGLAALGHIA
jgi:aminoglycoside phosphotransferase (APT) family kinase protein